VHRRCLSGATRIGGLQRRKWRKIKAHEHLRQNEYYSFSPHPYSRCQKNWLCLSKNGATGRVTAVLAAVDPAAHRLLKCFLDNKLCVYVQILIQRFRHPVYDVPVGG
jgi:hypothetical protein